MKREQSARLGSWYLWLTLSGVLAMEIYGMLRHYWDGMVLWVITLAAWPVVHSFTVLLHELAHLSVAWALGSKIRAFSAGPFQFWDNGKGRRQTRLDWSRTLRGGGLVAAEPRSLANARWDFALINIAGPVVSLGSGALLLLLFWNFPWPDSEALRRVVGFAAIDGLITCLMTLVPVQGNDGHSFLHLVLDTAQGRDYVDAIRIGAPLQEAHGDSAAELEALRQAVEEYETSPPAGESARASAGAVHWRYALASLRRWDRKQAEHHYKKALEFLDGHESHVLVQAEVLRGLAEIYSHQGRYAEVRQTAARAIEAFQRVDYSSLSPQSQAVLWFAQAVLHCEVRDFEAARHACEQLRPQATDPTVAALFCLATACRTLETGDLSAGAESLDASLQALCKCTDADAVELISVAASLYFQFGFHEEAVAAQAEACARARTTGEIEQPARMHLEKARLLIACGDLAAGEAALPLEPRPSSPLIHQWLVATGTLLVRQRRPEQALPLLQRYLDLQIVHWGGDAFPEVAAGQAELADACTQAGRAAEAEVLASKAIDTLRAFPDHIGLPCAHFARARARWQQQSDQTATQDFAEALSLVRRNEELKPAPRARLLELEQRALQAQGRHAEAVLLIRPIEGLWARTARSLVAPTTRS